MARNTSWFTVTVLLLNRSLYVEKNGRSCVLVYGACCSGKETAERLGVGTGLLSNSLLSLSAGLVKT